jgi:hypothetical protein
LISIPELKGLARFLRRSKPHDQKWWATANDPKVRKQMLKIVKPLQDSYPISRSTGTLADEIISIYNDSLADYIYAESDEDKVAASEDMVALGEDLEEYLPDIAAGRM